MAPKRPGPLTGLKVLELGHYIAAPFCTRILADLGAEVIKVEPPGGDPFRGWGEAKDGHSVWFSVHGRNKLSIELDLKRDRDTLLKLAARADVLVENMRAGQLETAEDRTGRTARSEPSARDRPYLWLRAGWTVSRQAGLRGDWRGNGWPAAFDRASRRHLRTSAAALRDFRQRRSGGPLRRDRPVGGGVAAGYRWRRSGWR